MYILITDLGTTLCKSILFDLHCRTVAEASCIHATKHPRPLWAQQHPESWWQAFKSTLKMVLDKSNSSPDDIDIIGIIGMGHGPVLVDADGKSIFTCMIWPDLRASKQAVKLRSKVAELGIERSIGGIIEGWYTAAKLLWIRENRPDVFERIHKVLLPKDYIRSRLTGEFATDHSDAAGTQLYDIHQHKWIRKLVDFFGLPYDSLPNIHMMDEVIGEVSPEAAQETGLATGTRVMVGANDWGPIPVGLGPLNPGEGFIYLGTAPGFGLCLNKEVREDIVFELGLGCRPHNSSPGNWLLEGVLSVAGASLTWFIEQFEHVSKQKVVDNQEIFDRLELEARSISPGSDGLFFMPHLMGERCPGNANARAVLFGLSLGHTRAHVLRSMYEGIAFTLKRAIESVEERVEVKSKTYKVFGGGSKSRLLLEILANVLAKPILLPKEEEICALGLALIASAKLKQEQLVTDKRVIETRATVQPQNDLVSCYKKSYDIFKRIEETMTPAYNYLSTLN